MDTFQLDGFKLVGIKLDQKTTNKGEQSNIDCGKLWQKFEKEGIYQKIPGNPSEVYAVYFDYEGDHMAPFDYFIGCKVESGTETPDGLHQLEIPEQTYTKVVAKGQMPNCIADAWRKIWNSDYDRNFQYDFEVYDHRSQDWSNAEVDIYLALK